MKKCIDISKHNGNINWEKVKNNIDCVILRCGYGNDTIKQDDKMFLINAKECERLGIPYGVYLYSYAKTTVEAVSEAKHILRMLNGRNVSLPIYIDVEEAGTEGVAQKTVDIVTKIIKEAGYTAGVYANLNWLNNYVKNVEGLSVWVAQWSDKCTYKGKYDIWQYSSNGSVDGINGRVDMNECYIGETAEKNEPKKEEASPEEYYKVVKGDTLSAIAKKYKTTVKKLAELNPDIKNVNLIYPDQKVRVK